MTRIYEVISLRSGKTDSQINWLSDRSPHKCINTLAHMMLERQSPTWAICVVTYDRRQSKLSINRLPSQHTADNNRVQWLIPHRNWKICWDTFDQFELLVSSVTTLPVTIALPLTLASLVNARNHVCHRTSWLIPFSRHFENGEMVGLSG